MADIYITGIPDSLFEEVEERARKAGHTTNDELLKIVGSALERSTPEEHDERRPESPLDD